MISVIVPVYNIEPYLRPCMDSILCQSFRDFELLLIDDGSTDGSGAVCDAYAKQDSRIRVLHQSNAGLAAARNCGTMAALGEYLTYIDGDDMVAPDYLMCLWNAMRQTGADIAVCGFHRFRDAPPASRKELPEAAVGVMTGREACIQIVNHHETGLIVVWGKLFPASMREQLMMPAGKLFEDEFVTYRLFFRARTVAVTRCKAYLYRQRANSISNAPFHSHSLDKLEALRGAAEWLDAQGDRELGLYARKRYLLSIAIHWRKARIGGAGKPLLHQLREEYRLCCMERGKAIRACCTVAERLAMAAFRLSPGLYRFLSGIYLVLFGED